MRNHLLDSSISYYGIFFLAKYLPVRLTRLIGKLIVSVVYVFSRKDRHGLAFNLSQALNLPMDDPLIRQTVRRIFMNYGQYMADFFIIPQCSDSRIKDFFSYLKGKEQLEQILAEGKGAILLTAHLGNWEIGGSLLRAMNYPLTLVVMEHNSAPSNAFVNQLRDNKGINITQVDQSPFSGLEILNRLRRNEIIAMSGDKDFFGKGRSISFFGNQVNFPVGPLALSMASGAPIIPAFVLLQKDGRYFGILEESIWPGKLNHSEIRSKYLDNNLTKIVRIFEHYIRSYPDQWYCPDPINQPAVAGIHE